MSKKIILILIILVGIILIVGSIYFKLKYDNKKEKEQQYYDEQKERITLYMRYNVKGFKSIKFTEIRKNPMDGYDIKGYLNGDKNISFTAGITSIDDFNFDADLSYSKELSEKFIKNTKSVSQIKKEKSKKEEK
ncbi:hypothetical protein HMPREF2580_09365 [Staphylococcus sp. HMSC036D05]|uniref:DUF1433 domain-containing protein n=1 Tax=Staphylococcus sp. HMSC036D05 TaxID=1715059 RepID=UPI0008AA0C89|nr:DUF1433 domain-containing protein [Staphylococcus sp. HMSC036D05]OHO71005.1 hypothetical protein HMPREF2580_09365 [Staphylococcus sp. HMSC036D05]